MLCVTHNLLHKITLVVACLSGIRFLIERAEIEKKKLFANLLELIDAGVKAQTLREF